MGHGPVCGYITCGEMMGMLVPCMISGLSRIGTVPITWPPPTVLDGRGGCRIHGVGWDGALAEDVRGLSGLFTGLAADAENHRQPNYNMPIRNQQRPSIDPQLLAWLF